MLDKVAKVWHSIRAQEKAHIDNRIVEYLLQFCREQREEKQRQPEYARRPSRVEHGEWTTSEEEYEVDA